MTTVIKNKKTISKSLNDEPSRENKPTEKNALSQFLHENSFHKIMNEINEISYINKKKNSKLQEKSVIEDEALQSSQKEQPQESRANHGGRAYRRLNSILKKTNPCFSDKHLPQSSTAPSRLSIVQKSLDLAKGAKTIAYRIKDSKGMT